MTLETFGWNDFFAKAFEPFQQEGFSAGRIAVQHKTQYIVYTEFGELRGELTGKIHYYADGPQDFPAVGDWVVLHARPQEQSATIHELLPRKARFSRKIAGRRVEQQIIAANIDVIFLISGLDHDYNLRRLERYLVLAAESGAKPVVVLNKADLCSDLDEKRNEVHTIAPGVPLLTTSAIDDKGLDGILSYLKPGITGALLGSSGVGKSTIVNHLTGQDLLRTQEVRAGDSRGRHTTTWRELILLPGGGLLIDTPGMRELQLCGGEEGMESIFGDIDALADQCRFRDCTHTTEPGCAVQSALSEGTLDEAHFRNFQKLRKEVAFFNRKFDESAQRKQKEYDKRIARQIKQIYKTRKKP